MNEFAGSTTGSEGSIILNSDGSFIINGDSVSGMPSERSKVLREADELINGDRNVTYGSPTENFTRISEFWTTRFSNKLKDGEKFTASDVADAMVLLKIARNVTQPKRDNYVDGAGYFACGYEASLNDD